MLKGYRSSREGFFDVSAPPTVEPARLTGLLTIFRWTGPIRQCGFRSNLSASYGVQSQPDSQTGHNLEDEMPRSRRTQTSKKADAIAWQTEFLRVSAFPISGATVVPNSWKEIAGNDPDEIVK